MLCVCHGSAMGLPYDQSAMGPPWLCRRPAMDLPWVCYGYAKGMRRETHPVNGCAMGVPWASHGYVMGPPWSSTNMQRFAMGMLLRECLGHAMGVPYLCRANAANVLRVRNWYAKSLIGVCMLWVRHGTATNMPGVRGIFPACACYRCPAAAVYSCGVTGVPRVCYWSADAMRYIIM